MEEGRREDPKQIQLHSVKAVHNNRGPPCHVHEFHDSDGECIRRCPVGSKSVLKNEEAVVNVEVKKCARK